jgi:lipopolysaccharide transport system permease protein
MNPQEQDNWTEVIKPDRPLFSLNLGELWRYRDLIFIFVRRDIVAVYKQTILGPLWFVLGPIFTVITFTFVFNNIAGISTDGIPAPLFYLAGTTFWNYFQNSFTGTSTTFVANAHIFGKVYFPRLSVPLSLVISNLLKFGIQMFIFAGFWAYYYAQGLIQVSWHLALTPLLILLMAGIALGSGILISALTTKYRDLNHFIGFGVALLMYASPVIYPVSSIPEMYRGILMANPIAPVIEAFRFASTGSGTFSWVGLAYSSGFMVLVLWVGIAVFNNVERRFMDTV